MARRSAPTPPPPPPPAEVSAAELARLAGYSKMQVSKWGPMGLSKLGRVVLQGTQKRILYRRDEALAWIKGNATGVPGAHGGKRAGGGRKPGAKVSRFQGDEGKATNPRHLDTSAPDTSSGATSTPVPPSPRRLTPPRHVEPVAPPPSTPGHLGTSTPAPAAPLTREELRDLTPIEVKQHLDIEKILSERIARGEKERTLISVEAARKEWSDACTAAARVLGKLRDTLAARLITDLGLASSKAPRLRQVIDQETVHVLRAMRTASFGPEDDDALG